MSLFTPTQALMLTGALIVCGALLRGAVGMGILFLIGFRPLLACSEGAHWTERARLAWPGRVLMAAGLVLVPLLAGLPILVTATPALPWAWALLSMALSGLLWVICARAAGRWIGLPVGTLMDAVARVSANAAIFWGPLGGAALLAMALGAGGPAPPLLIGILTLLYLHQRGAVLPLARRLGLVWAPGPRLRIAVESATRSAGLPRPEIHVLPSVRAQAWCLPVGRRLIFSSRLLQLLDEAELLAVVTHEVAHLRQPMSLQLLGLLPPTIALGLAAALGLFVAKGEPWTVLPPIGACVAAGMLHGGLLSLLETSAEEDADRRAAQVNAKAHAEALERVYESDLLPAVSADRAHPDLYARLVAAGHRPGWSRPSAPPRWPVPVALLAFCLWSVASLSHQAMAWALPLHPKVVDTAGRVDPQALLDHLRDTGR